MKCNKCQTEILAEQKFCAACGAEAITATASPAGEVSVDRAKLAEVCNGVASLATEVKALKGNDAAFNEKVPEFNRRFDAIETAQKELHKTFADRKMSFNLDDGAGKEEQACREIIRAHAFGLAALKMHNQAEYQKAVVMLRAKYAIKPELFDRVMNTRVVGLTSSPCNYLELNRGSSPYKELQESISRAMDTATANEGTEFVYAAMSSELIRTTRYENKLLANVFTFDMPQNPYIWPLEGSDPTIYYVAENTSDTGDKVGASTTGSRKMQMDARKLGERILWSYELTADSVIALGPLLTSQAIAAMNDAIEYGVVRGDTAAGNGANINKNDGTPTTTGGAASKYLVTNGLHKFCIDGITHNSVARSGVLYDVATLSTAAGSNDYVLMLAQMGKYGLNPQDLMFLHTPGSYFKALQLAEVLTIDKFGASATVLKGQLASVMGIPIVVSGAIPKTENGQTGEIIGTPSTTKDHITAIYRPGVIVGFAEIEGTKRVLVEQERDIETQQHKMVATVRFDVLLPKDDSTGEKSVVLGYDVD